MVPWSRRGRSNADEENGWDSEYILKAGSTGLVMEQVWGTVEIMRLQVWLEQLEEWNYSLLKWGRRWKEQVGANIRSSAFDRLSLIYSDLVRFH